MEIYSKKELNGEAMYFSTNSTEFNSVFLNLMNLFPNNVLKVSSDNGQYFITIDLLSSKEKEDALNYFKEKKLYTGIHVIDYIVPEKIEKEIFHPASYKEEMVDRVFVFHNMPDTKYNGLTPLNALYQYKDDAFIMMYLNYPYFKETEKPFIANACKMFLQKEIKIKNTSVLNEIEAKSFLSKYEPVYFPMEKEILSNKYRKLSEFLASENLISLRNACEKVIKFLETNIER